jgi:sirohydrochlorin ferrochelatase
MTNPAKNLAETGVILFAHGSRLDGANNQARDLAARFKAAGRFPICEAAFLELARPSMAEAAQACVAQGARRLVIVPYFLAIGRHVAKDIPVLVEETRRALGPSGETFPIEVTDILGSHPAILDIITTLVDRGAPGAGA